MLQKSNNSLLVDVQCCLRGTGDKTDMDINLCVSLPSPLLESIYESTLITHVSFSSSQRLGGGVLAACHRGFRE